jgi:hypothetical protein
LKDQRKNGTGGGRAGCGRINVRCPKGLVGPNRPLIPPSWVRYCPASAEAARQNPLARKIMTGLLTCPRSPAYAGLKPRSGAWTQLHLFPAIPSVACPRHGNETDAAILLLAGEARQGYVIRSQWGPDMAVEGRDATLFTRAAPAGCATGVVAGRSRNRPPHVGSRKPMASSEPGSSY